MATGDPLSFGPFVLDPIARRLTRDGEEMLLGDRHLGLVCLLTSRPGEVLSKDLLTDTAWRGVALTTNSLDQAISTLRRTLTLPSGEPCIETRARRGYRFVAKLSPVVRRESDEALDAVMEAHRAWIEGRAALGCVALHSLLGLLLLARGEHVVRHRRDPRCRRRSRRSAGSVARVPQSCTRAPDGSRGTR